MPRIKAAVCTEFGAPLSIEELDLRAPLAGEIEVTLEAVAICHSDISYAEGAWSGPLPAVYGHEAAGKISAVGPGVNNLRVGDDVVVTLILACGTCPTCASGKPTLCSTRQPLPPKLTRPDGPTLEARNRVLHRMLVDGVSVEYRHPEGGIRGAQVRVIDFDDPSAND